MRVLMINKRAPFEGRGAEQVIWKIGTRFAEAGHRVRFFCPNPKAETSVPDREGVDFRFVETSSNPTRGMIEFFLRGPRSYRKSYREFEPDVVYDNPSPFPFHLAHVYGDAPVVNKVHAIYRSYAFACKDHPLVKGGTVLGEETYRLLRGEYFITNSESTAQRLRGLVNTTKNELVANPIGIDASAFEYHVPEHSKQVVTVSKLSPRKRIQDLLRAWRSVEETHPNASLTIAGSGPRGDKLQNLRDELGIENVSFPGFVSEDRKHQLLRDAGIFAFPTLYEGFGISNLEAMASGCAVVTSDTWGVKDYMENGTNGRTVPPKSPEQFGAVLRELLDDQSLRRQFGKSARETAETYSMRASLDRELEYLEAVRREESLESPG